MIYRGSRDGFTNAIFHLRCDGKGPTLVIFKTTKGRICGGYTEEVWETPLTNKWKQDSKAFLFSIDLLATYPVADSSKTIYCCADFGPYFGNCDLGIHGEPLNGKDNGYCRTGKNFNVPTDIDENSEITGELNKFTLADIEVYQVKEIQ
jgi:hypothetical protein